jgi:hypothetical protein
MVRKQIDLSITIAASIQFNSIHRQRIPVSHLCLTMANTSSLATAKAKLHDFPVEDLPNDPNNPLWTRIEEKYGLSLPEISALMKVSAGTVPCYSTIKNWSPHFIRNEFEFAFASSAYYPNYICC